MRPFGIDLDRPRVMAILNATPDSFSDGGLLDQVDVGARCAGLLADGADILDVGGESTRPGHTPVSAAQEIERVLPVIRAIRALDQDVPISIDTSKAVVAEAALSAGATFVNDVSGLRDPGMAGLVGDAGCGIVLMRNGDLSGDVVAACQSELRTILDRADGVEPEQIMLDPGLGFGARPGPYVADNLALIDGMEQYRGGYPVLIGASRKRFVAALAGPKEDRVAASVDIAVRAIKAGADVVRVHDVAPTVAALRAL